MILARFNNNLNDPVWVNGMTIGEDSWDGAVYGLVGIVGFCSCLYIWAYMIASHIKSAGQQNIFKVQI